MGRFAGFYNILDLDVDDATDDVVAATLVWQRAELLLHGQRGATPDGHVAAEFLLGEQAGGEPIVEVVAVVSDFVREVGDLRFEGGRLRAEAFAAGGVVKAGGVLGETFAHFPREIQAGKAGIFLFEKFDDPEALPVVLEAPVGLHELVQCLLALVPERGMAEVVGEGDGLGEVLVQLEGASDIAGDRGDFHRVGEARAQVIPGAIEKHLRFVFKAPKRPRVDDAVAVALVVGPQFRRRFLVDPAAALGAELGVGGEDKALARFEFRAGAGHGQFVKTLNR